MALLKYFGCKALHIFSYEKIHWVESELFLCLQYANQCMHQLDYRAVWWQLFYSPNSSSWPNVLASVNCYSPYQSPMGNLKEYSKVD